jgi:hypothetical protein
MELSAGAPMVYKAVDGGRDEEAVEKLEEGKSL